MKPNNPAPGPAPGPTESDNLCKRLAELYPEQFAQWLFGVSNVAVQKTELSREPSAVIFAHQDAETLHVEFQTTHHSEVPLPLRMLDYYVGQTAKPATKGAPGLSPAQTDENPYPRTVHG